METSFRELNAKQRRHLRGLAHNLRPAVQVGRAGITKSVLAAIDDSLDHHELIKVKLNHKVSKDATAIAAICSATLCGVIGNIVILYRRHPEKPKIDPYSSDVPAFSEPV